jgi:L-asparaginase / beta-aspartyl-peptidase
MTGIVVHGGAGSVAPERHDRLRAGVRAAAAVGHAILAAGGGALDAVVAAVRVLEDDPEFNAGHGAALTRDSTVETDAAVMDGAAQRVGAVGAVPELGCAIALARAVLDAGEHVLLVGPAALRFAGEVGISAAAVGALVTERARRQLARLGDPAEGRRGSIDGGTVGAVARDRDGRFAAATSTGGIAGKRSGRVGDSAIAGAGTWADGGIAISATGDGEAIVRMGLARVLALRVADGLPLRTAAERGLAELACVTGGTAGLIALDTRGAVMLQLSPTMPVAFHLADLTGDGLGEQWTDHSAGPTSH